MLRVGHTGETAFKHIELQQLTAERMYCEIYVYACSIYDVYIAVSTVTTVYICPHICRTFCVVSSSFLSSHLRLPLVGMFVIRFVFTAYSDGRMPSNRRWVSL